MVGYYHKLFSDKECDEVFSECKEGKRGCVNCKKQLARNISNYLLPIREKRRYYEEHKNIVKDILMEGTKKAGKVASDTVKNVKEAMKINYFN